MEELDRIKDGISNSNLLLYKSDGPGLKCSFVKEGRVVDSFVVEDDVLASALSKKGVHGVVEGSNLEMLRNNYDWFSLSVKTKKLFNELK